MHKASILHQLNQSKRDLRKSEQKVAEYVLANAQDVIHMRIVDLATESQVSEPTIVRFCRAIGFDSFQSFKLNLAQQLAIAQHQVPFPVSPGDSLEEVGTKLIGGTAHSLLGLIQSLDWTALEQAVDRLAQSRRIDFCGIGASASVAQDAHQKFLRLHPLSHCYQDPELQAINAALLTPDDTVIILSHSGENRLLVQLADIVLQSGAQLISLCPPQSTLASRAHLTLAIAVNEDSDRFTPMIARLAQLLVLDILATGLYLRRGADARAHLDKVRQTLQSWQ